MKSLGTCSLSHKLEIGKGLILTDLLKIIMIIQHLQLCYAFALSVEIENSSLNVRKWNEELTPFEVSESNYII